MNKRAPLWRGTGRILAALVLAGLVAALTGPGTALAGGPWNAWWHRFFSGGACQPSGVDGDGDWYWLRSPEQEKRVVIGLYNRYCLRCHGVDGRGVWDIPCVPDFTNACWQESRSDPQLVRIILEGRGAVMPPFRGTLSLEEAWAMARYLRSFLAGAEANRPSFSRPAEPAKAAETAPPGKE
jgi:hypothetical protein